MESSTSSLETRISSTFSSVDSKVQSKENSINTIESTTVSSDQSVDSSSVTEESIIKKTVSNNNEPIGGNFFVSIMNRDYVLLDKSNGNVIDDNKENYQKTFAAREAIHDGTKYYLLSTFESELGLIDPNSTEKAVGEQGKLFPEENVYGSIVSDTSELLTSDFEENGTTEELMDRTFEIEGFYNHFDGTKYYSLKDSSDQPIGVVNAAAIEKSSDKAGKKHPVNDYYSIVKNDHKIWEKPGLEEIGSTTSIFERTFNVKEWYYHYEGKKYFAIYDNGGTFKGFVGGDAIQKASNPGGIWYDTNEYVTVTKDSLTIWKDFDFKNGNSTKSMYQRTYRVTGYYNHFNGSKYVSVYDNKGVWQGYLRADYVDTFNTPGGKWNSTNQYITVTKNNWTIWKDFNFKTGSSTKGLCQRTYRVTGWYRHYNGSKYLSVYDNKGVWQGYLNEGGAKLVNNPGGKWNTTNQYVTITKNNWTIWKDFNFKNGNSTKSMYQKTYRVTGWYRHYNGSKYLSVYDNKGTWQGYLNEGGAQVVNNPGGKWNATNQYVTITKNNWTIWKDFNFKNGTSTKSMYQKTYRVTGWYRHFNGAKYLSLYDNKGNWQGYLNEGGAAKAGGAQGTGFSTNKSVLVTKSGYSIWDNFNWKEKARTNSLINKTYQVKWYYRHMNGSTYYSLYESNGKWFGYVNSDAVRERRGVSHYLGNSRQSVINELSAHQNDRFYLGTPYRGLSSSNPEPFLSPYGAPNGYGPGMNCTGFVAYVMRRSGGNLNRISGITQGWGSYANAYNWRDALMRNTEYYTFGSVDALLRSGKAQKGDIIYFDPVWTDINYDCHIGIFWGNRSNENRIWHQVLAGNMQSHIFSGTRFSKIYLFPQD
ncbi:hypothetical protein [Enterococcus sp. AZ007]